MFSTRRATIALTAVLVAAMAAPASAITLPGAAAIALVDVGLPASTNENFRIGNELQLVDSTADATDGHCWHVTGGRVRCHLTITIKGIETCRGEALVLSHRHHGRLMVWGHQVRPLVCDRQDAGH